MPTSLPALSALGALPPSLSERTIEAIRQGVRSGELVPGELYSVYRLAEELGISRSPVREALLRLAETGLIKFERNRGFRVVMPAPHDIAEVFAIRLALEVPAVRRATMQADAAERLAVREQYEAMEEAAASGDQAAFERHDQQLHTLIMAIEGNKRTQDIVSNLRDAIRLVGASTVGLDRSLGDVLVDHAPIVEAFQRGDPEAAALAMENHLRATGRLLLHRALEASGDLDSEDRLWSKLIG